jgi:hypothetical protein
MHAPSLWICAPTAASALPLAPLLLCQGVKVKNHAGESLHGSGSGVADESLEVFAIRVHALHSRTTANFTRRIKGPLAGCTAHALMPTLSARHDAAALQDRRRSAVWNLKIMRQQELSCSVSSPSFGLRRRHEPVALSCLAASCKPSQTARNGPTGAARVFVCVWDLCTTHSRARVIPRPRNHPHVRVDVN